uniref:Variant surface glycoprotein 1125.2757 n=1 Tax=Trypanosoma brucei TaxID=5691 RepID=A0A1J0R8Y1_9TRYP|nr:variant surface glycoprotein 1125.2757 [Trypanosoma brucei]
MQEMVAEPNISILIYVGNLTECRKAVRGSSEKGSQAGIKVRKRVLDVIFILSAFVGGKLTGHRGRAHTRISYLLHATVAMHNESQTHPRRVFSESRVASMKQLLTIALVSATSAWCEAAETANQKAAKATTPCGELLFLTEATKKLTGQTTHNLNMAAELSKETRTYRLAGCRATNPKQKLKFVLLEAIAAARLHKALQAADNTAHSEAQAAQSLAARAVQLKSLIANGVNKTSYTAAASYGNKQSGIFSGTAETCTVHLSNTPTTELTCIGQLPDANDIKEAAADVMKETEMKMQPDEAFSTLKLTLTVAAKGTLSTGGNALTDNSGCTNNNDVAGPKASANNAL